MKIVFLLLNIFILSGSFRLQMTIPDRVIRNKNFLIEKSYNTLVKNIEDHKIKNIYFTERLDTVISEDVEKTDSDNYNYNYNYNNIMKDYTFTKITPFVTNNLVDLSVKNDVITIFATFKKSGNS